MNEHEEAAVQHTAASSLTHFIPILKNTPPPVTLSIGHYTLPALPAGNASLCPYHYFFVLHPELNLSFFLLLVIQLQPQNYTATICKIASTAEGEARYQLIPYLLCRLHTGGFPLQLCIQYLIGKLPVIKPVAACQCSEEHTQELRVRIVLLPRFLIAERRQHEAD